MNRAIPVLRAGDVPAPYRDTPIDQLLRFHNVGEPFETFDRARLLVGMCMDHRKHLRIPDNFAYIIRAGGGNLRYSEFKVAYAIAVGGVRTIALLAHTNCGMVNLVARRREFVEGLVEHAGWDRDRAEEHFSHFAPMFEIGNEIDFVLSEAARLRVRFPKILVAPMLYRVEDNRLYPLREDGVR